MNGRGRRGFFTADVAPRVGLDYDQSANTLGLLDGAITITGSTETGKGMTAVSETATEDVFLEVDVGSNSYQIPPYDA